MIPPRPARHTATAVAAWRALQADPGSAEALRGRGRVFSEEGRAAEALRELERAISTDPRDAQAWWWIGRELQEIARRVGG